MKLDKSKIAWMLMIGVAVVGLTLWGESPGSTTAAPGTPRPAAAVGNTPDTPVVATTAAMGYGDEPSAPKPTPVPIEPPLNIVMPTGTPMRIRLNAGVGTAVSRPGDRFSGTLVSPAVVNGVTVLPAGTSVGGTIVSSAPSGRLHGRAVLTLRLNTVFLHGETLRVATNADTRTSRGHKKRNLLWIGGGSSGGLLIGALAGGPVGAVIGAGSGAVAGLGGAVITGRRQVRLPAETELTFRLSRPLTLPGSRPAS